MPTRKRRIKQAPVIEAFAKRLKEVRTACGMTQKGLAEKAHVTLSYVSKLEAGGAAPGLDLLERLAESLGVTISELLPRPVAVDVADQRKSLQLRFEALVSKSGEETISMLNSLLMRLGEAPTIGR